MRMYVRVARVSTHPRQKLRDCAITYFSYGESFQYVFRSLRLVVRRGVMLGIVVCTNFYPLVPIDIYYFAHIFLFQPIILHIPCFTSFCSHILMCKQVSSIVICLILIGRWGCPIPSSILLITNAVLAFLNIPPHSASAAEHTTFFKVLHSVKIGALFGDLL